MRRKHLIKPLTIFEKLVSFLSATGRRGGEPDPHIDTLSLTSNTNRLKTLDNLRPATVAGVTYIPQDTMKSLVWKHFTSVSPKEATCNHCLKKVKVAGGTSNLRAHLKKWHWSAFAQMTSQTAASPGAEVDELHLEIGEAAKPRKLKQTATENQDTDPSASKSRKKLKRQTTSMDIHSGVKSFKAGSLKDGAITDAILYMVCKDGLPLSATEHEGLRFLLKTTVPLYEVPGRKKLTTLLENKYSSLREAVKQHLSQAQWVSITLDLTSVTTKGYLIVSGHFIDSGSLWSICLGVSELTPSRTGDHIASDLSLVLQSWNLDTEKICSVTTNGGADIIPALRKLLGSEDTHVPCFAHLLNLCVCRSLETHDNVKAVTDKVKSIIDYFRRSISASDALRAAQHQSGVQASRELLQPVVNQGNSTFYSLERFSDLAGFVNQVMLSADHLTAPPMLTSEELALVSDVVSLLRPFEKAIKEVSGEKYVTATIIIPIVNCLKESVSLASQLFTSEDSSLLSEMLLDNIDQQLIPLEANSLLSSATVLDPRFKLIHFQQPLNSGNTLQLLSLELHNLAAGSTSDAAAPHVEEEISGPIESLWQIHDQLASRLSIEVDMPSGTELHPELKLYLNLPVVARSACPLKFWLDREQTFPTLARLAQKYLSVMGSSIASEHIISLVNSTTCDPQSRLLPEHINMLVFMSSLENNTWFCE